MLKPNRISNFLLVLLALLAPYASSANSDDADTDALKAESPVVLPAPFQKNNLLSFYVSPTTTLDFAVDAKSVSVTEEGIVRFVLVVTSQSGASNISYEGIRCSTGERKLYAVGQTNGSWTAARRDVWETIIDRGINRQHAALAKDYFCETGMVAGKAEVIVDRLRKKKALR
jgi:CNP1-like family